MSRSSRAITSFAPEEHGDDGLELRAGVALAALYFDVVGQFSLPHVQVTSDGFALGLCRRARGSGELPDDHNSRSCAA